MRIIGIPEALNQLQPLQKKIQIEVVVPINPENQRPQNKTKNAGINLLSTNYFKI